MNRVARDSVWSGTPVQIVQYKKDDGTLMVDMYEADKEAVVSMGELWRAKLDEAKAYHTLLGIAIKDMEEMEARAAERCKPDSSSTSAK